MPPGEAEVPPGGHHPVRGEGGERGLRGRRRFVVHDDDFDVGAGALSRTLSRQLAVASEFLQLRITTETFTGSVAIVFRLGGSVRHAAQILAAGSNGETDASTARLVAWRKPRP